MAIGWFTVLKSVPWDTVISNAPAVADGARRLWKTVASKRVGTADDAVPDDSDTASSAAAPDPVTASPIDAQLSELRQSAERLEQQMLASSELINALAEQNAQLIERVESQRVRTLWLSRWLLGAGALAVLALAAALIALTRG